MQRTKGRRLLSMLMALILGLSLLPVTMVSADEPGNFSIVTITGALLADGGTKYVILYKQNPVNKLITATVQIQHNSSDARNLAIMVVGVEISFNENKVAPYAYYPTSMSGGLIVRDYANANTTFNASLLFSGKRANILLDFYQYSDSFLSNVDTYANTYMRRDGTGGVVGCTIASTDGRYPLTVAPGQAVNVAEFYFMPVNGTDTLDIDMFGYEYVFDGPAGMLRNTPHMINGDYRLEADSRNIPIQYISTISPASFKIHVERPLLVYANDAARTITGYDTDTMEWSDDGGVTYKGGTPVIPDTACTIYVRTLGDSAYSRTAGLFNDAQYGNYKKYVPSETQVVFEAKGGTTTTYTVTFDGNGGIPAEQIRIVDENTAVGLNNMPSQPVRDGYTFKEWNTAQNGSGTAFTGTTIVTADIRVYAQWTANPHTVTYKANGGTGNDVVENVVYGQSYTAAANTFTPPSGQNFSRWNTAANGQGTSYLVGSTINIAGDVELFAQWDTIPTCTVTFDGNGGTPAEQTRVVNKDTAVGAGNMPDQPVRGGFTFKEWNTAQNGSGTAFTATTIVTADIRVYAQWDAIPTCTVTFDGNGGTPAEQTRVVEKDTAVGLDNMPGQPTRGGYTFKEWNTAQNGSGTAFTATTIVTADIRVYAQWDLIPPATCTVTFDSNGGTPTEQTRVVDEGTALGDQMPPHPQRTGFNFMGWNTAQNGTGTAFTATTIVTADIRVYAQWDKAPILVEFELDGGVLTGATSKIVYFGEPYGELPRASGAWSVSKPGGFDYIWVFGGWFKSPTQMSSLIEETSPVADANDHKLYARWQMVSLFDTYTVTFDGNGGTPAMQTRTIEQDTAIGAGNMPTEPERDDYDFTGWNTARNGSGTAFTATTIVAGNIRVYAQWNPRPVYHNVIFDGNGGVPSEQTIIVEHGFTVGDEMPDPPTRSNYVFAGWNTAQNGSGTAFTSSTVVTNGIRVYAQWNPVIYTVIFDGNGGIPNTATREVAYGSTVGANNMPDEPTRFGYTFAGWNTAEDGSGTAFTATTVVTGNIRVFAQWNPEIYTVTFDGNGGTPSTVTREVAFGNAVGSNMPGEPTRDGHTFTGWNTAADGSGTAFTATTVVTGALKVFAQWKPEVYTVTFNGNDGEPNERKVEVLVNTALGNSMPSNPTRTGYTFAGWNTNRNGSGTAFTSTTIVGSNIEVFAQWTADPHTVTYKANGGTGADVVVNVVYNQTYTIAVNTFAPPSNQNFSEWNTAVSGPGTSYPVNSTTRIIGNLVLYARWATQPPPPPPTGGGTTYTVTFDGNGGTPATQTRSVAPNAAVGTANMPNAPTRSEHTFTGWNTAQNGSGTAFTAATTVAGNIRVYAQWERNIVDPPIPGGFGDDHIPYIQGYPDNSVRPNNAITRAEVAVIFFRLLIDEGKYTPRLSAFSDVANGVWYTQAINYLASIDILKGYPDGTFRPDQRITRAEFAAISARFDELEPLESNAFPDIANHWAKEYINSAAAKGWVNGYNDGTFRPQQNITRAEVVRIVNSMLNRKIKLEDIPAGIRMFTDFVGHWAYTDIVEASNDHDYIRGDDGYEIWTLK